MEQQYPPIGREVVIYLDPPVRRSNESSRLDALKITGVLLRVDEYGYHLGKVATGAWKALVPHQMVAYILDADLDIE